MSDPELTIAIATRERADLLPDVLRSCARQRLDDSLFEILVVADGVSDGTAAVCESFAHELADSRKGLIFRYVEPWHESRGLAAARNVCAAEAAGRYIRLQDDDDVMDPYAADEMLNAHSEFGPRTAVLGYTGIASHLVTLPIMRYLAFEGGELFNYRSVPRGALSFDWFWGGRSSVATAVVRSIGFDENLRFGAEDIEFAFRAAEQSGLSVHYSPAVRSYMIRAVDVRSFALRCFRQGQAALYVSRTHPGSKLEEWARTSHAYQALTGEGLVSFSNAFQRCHRLELVLDFQLQKGSARSEHRRILDAAYRETFGLARALGFSGADISFGRLNGA